MTEIEIIGIVGSVRGMLSVCYSIYFKKREMDIKEKQFDLGIN